MVPSTAEQHMNLAESFEKWIVPYTVLIHRKAENKEGWGTGVIIAANDGGALVITARHVVLGHTGSSVTWLVTRGWGRGDTPRTVQFTSDGNLQTSRNDAGFLIHNDEAYDVALILVPAECLEANQDFTGDTDSVPPLLEPQFSLKPGAPVAWAGFPGIAKSCLGRPTLCLYRGMVSATSMDPPVYLIDGNVAPGVSGGPVWDVTLPEPTLIGVVSQYWRDRDPEKKDMPGLSHFIPLNELGEFIKQLTGR